MIAARPLVPALCALGEGIQWDGTAGRLLWTDVQGRRLHSCDADGDDHRVLPLPARMASFALDPEGLLLGAFETGLFAFDPDSGRRVPVHEFEPDLPTTRLNDGRCDRSGRFLAGGVDEKGLKPLSSLISYDGAGPPRTLLGGIGCSNSIAFSPDGRLMYFTDTAGQEIFVFDYDPDTGAIADRRVFATLGPDDGRPDGSCVDSEGRLWNAAFGVGRVQCWNPDGSRGTAVHLPAPNVTCACFGGPDLGILYVTTASVLMGDAARAAAPLSGATFAFDAKAAFGATGLPEERFARPLRPLLQD